MNHANDFRSVIRFLCVILALGACTLQPVCAQILLPAYGKPIFMPGIGIVIETPLTPNTIYEIPIRQYYPFFPFEGILFGGPGYQANEIYYGYSMNNIGFAFPYHPGQLVLPAGASNASAIFFEDYFQSTSRHPQQGTVTAAIMPADAAVIIPEPGVAAIPIGLLVLGCVILWRKRHFTPSLMRR